jgi:transcriptional regulator with XRE-family HTH domain
MTTSTDMPKTIHQGKNVKRFREMMGLKQEALADKLGSDWTQKKVSYVETKEVIDPELLDQLAAALKVSSETLKNFDEEKAVLNVQNNYEGSNPNAGTVQEVNRHYHQCTFNPFDKYVETVEKNEKLYEALLKSEREKIALLEKIISEHKKK